MQGKKIIRNRVTQMARKACGRMHTIDITNTTRPREG
jgi:hypothetical protein